MEYPTYLIHYGVPGQKWGERKYQLEDGTWTEEGKERRRVGNNEITNNQPPNTTLLVNYSGPAIFISSNSDLKSLKPRVPKNYFTENGYEDSETERISFAPSIDKCLAGLSQNVNGKTYTVYSPDDVKKYSIYKPNEKAVPDSIITDEMWICEPVKLKKIGKITVTGNKNKPGKKFSYGDKQAELYDDWTYAELKHSNYLIHYGIQGQKWGVRRWQYEDGSLTPEGYEHYGLKNLKKAKTANLDKWGKSPDTNILYITGYSGSGKSTTSVGLAKKNDISIHLDAYAENDNEAAQNKKFNDFLDKHVPDWRKIGQATKNGDNGTLKRFSKDYFKLVDQFRDALESFSKKEYSKGHRCIAEGVQIADNWLSEDKNYFSGKPIVIMKTSAITSMSRAFDRDGKGNLLKGLGDFESAKEYIDWYKISNTKLNELSDTTQAKKYQKYLKQFLEQYGNTII